MAPTPDDIWWLSFLILLCSGTALLAVGWFWVRLFITVAQVATGLVRRLG